MSAGDAPTWSIAEVERDTGLGKDALRVWERRYGFPQPLRDRLGERVYPEAQLQRLRLVKRLLDVGHRPGKVVALSLEQLQALLVAVPATPARRGRAAAGQRDGSDARDERAVPAALSTSPVPALTDALPWLTWLQAGRTDLIRQALQQQILRQGLGAVVDRQIGPLCVWVGDAWVRGEVSVYQEHLFTETLQSVLREAIASVDAGGQALQQAPRVLLTTTPNEQHGLGLLMAECHFALESCTRFVLGTSTPLADIVQAVAQLRIDVLALSFSAHAARRDMVDSLRQLVRQLPAGVEIWVGGAAVALHQRALPEGLVLMRQASDVALQVQQWRQRR